MAHTHDGTAGNGAQITSAGLASGAATDSVIGNRTADPTQAPAGSSGTITQLFSWISNRIKAMLGTTNWYDAPPTTLTAANTHINATTGVHGATSAATANALMTRDASGRAQVAAPSAAADIARKDTVDAVATVANAALPAASYTAADVLAKVKTVDGAGSGLDADLFDGSDSSVFWKTSQLRTTNGYLEWLNGGVWEAVGTKFDKTAMTQLVAFGTVVSITNPGWTTALNISGKGYLDEFMCYSESGGSGIYNNVRITVDGVQKVLTVGSGSVATGYANRHVTNAAYNGGGIGPMTLPYAMGNNLLAYGNTVPPGNYPDTSGTKALVVSADSIFFSSSLLVEVRAGSGQSGNGHLTYSGGYI